MPTISFPFRRTTAGFPVMVSDEDEAIKDNIKQIVMTRPGEVPMQPEFGCRVPDLVFENSDEDFSRMLYREINTALSRWEPRISVTKIVANEIESNKSKMIELTIEYEILQKGEGGEVTLTF